MISRVRIAGFKKIKDCSFDLDRLNVFIGPNNSGKSSVLQAIQFAIGTAQTGSRVGTRLNKNEGRESFSADTTAFLYLPIRELSALIHDRKLTQSTGADISFSSETLGETTISIKRGKNRNLSINMTPAPLLEQLKNSNAPYCVYTPGLSGISISEEFKTKAVVLKSATRGDSNLYLRNVLLLLKENPEAWEKFSNAVRYFFPDCTIQVEFSPDTDETIEIFVKTIDDDGQEFILPIDAMGTSALQILQIISYVYYFNPPMLILDEPDTHLHPNNQRRLISILNDISVETNMQVLIATHSRHIIDEARELASFFWMQNGTLTKKISPYDDSQSDFIQIMMDLGALDVCDLTNPKLKWIICTEDAKVDTDKYLKNILVSSGFDLSTCKIVPYQGCGKIDSVVFLKQFIERYIPSLKILVHRDRDYLEDEEISKLKEKYNKQGIHLWITPGTDLESMFLNKEHLLKIYPEYSENEIQEILDSVFKNEQVRKNSVDRLSKHLIENDEKNSNNPRHRPNYADLVDQAKESFDNNPSKYAYGKTALGVFKDTMQKKHKKGTIIVTSSQGLFQSELNNLYTT